MTKLKKALYLSDQIRRCETKAMTEMGLSGEDLMLRAGTAAFNTLKNVYKEIKTIAVFCGAGNNAGDGYVLARLLHENGFRVYIHAYKPVENLPDLAKAAALQAVDAGVVIRALNEEIDSEAELIVDALLGIGLNGSVSGRMAEAIQHLNESNLPILSLDIPSGLEADTGRVLGVCVHAEMTLTFIGEKIGLYTLDGPDHAGNIVCDNLQINSTLLNITPAAYRLDSRSLSFMSPRLKNSHKGTYGHVLIIGGGPGMPGAPLLAANAALRVGAGMVSIAALPEHVASLSYLPEAMIYSVTDANSLVPLLQRATVGVIGPGLGESAWAKALFQTAIATQLPLVIDASALRLLAQSPQHDPNWILTPHPGEAADLLKTTTELVQQDRCHACAMIQQQYGGAVVLKGVGTIVNIGEPEAYVCAVGNPGMASPGMGDVLSGIIAGLLAQGVPLKEAAKLGVWFHAKAADEAVLSQGERGLLASDLMPYLRRQVNKWS